VITLEILAGADGSRGWSLVLRERVAGRRGALLARRRCWAAPAGRRGVRRWAAVRPAVGMGRLEGTVDWDLAQRLVVESAESLVATQRWELVGRVPEKMGRAVIAEKSPDG
jgi:hypothetical protein